RGHGQGPPLGGDRPRPEGAADHYPQWPPQRGDRLGRRMAAQDQPPGEPRCFPDGLAPRRRRRAYPARSRPGSGPRYRVVRYLLDTNVLSEVRRPHPEPRVLAWLDAVDEDRLYLSAITIGEIARGVALLDDGRRKQDLAAWLETDLQHRFGPRLLAIDGETALVW